MNIPDRKTVERVKEMYPEGCRIVLDEMDDPYTKIPVGTQGTVKGMDDTGSIMPAWDCGSSLAVVYGADRCHKLCTDEEALETIRWYGKHQPEEDARCPRCGDLMMGSKNRHALSRYADIMVCDKCGMIEALEKAGLVEAVPLMTEGIMTPEFYVIRERSCQDAIDGAEKDIQKLEERRQKIVDEIAYLIPWLETVRNFGNIKKLNRTILTTMIHYVDVYEHDRMTVRFRFTDDIAEITEGIDLTRPVKKKVVTIKKPTPDNPRMGLFSGYVPKDNKM